MRLRARALDFTSSTSRRGALNHEQGRLPMEIVVERCAGLDVHKDVVVACVRVPSDTCERETKLASFRTFTRDLLALRDWLVSLGVTRVGMEATGVYWKP